MKPITLGQSVRTSVASSPSGVWYQNTPRKHGQEGTVALLHEDGAIEVRHDDGTSAIYAANELMRILR